MGQITLRELEKMDFFKEIPKDILQNLLNESKVVSYKKKEMISFTQQNENSIFCVFWGSDALQSDQARK